MQFSIGHERSRARGHLRMALSMPFIYGMVVPIGFLDLSTRLYQSVCFPLYGIVPVDRTRYVYCSRRGKNVTTLLDQFNCWYCAYANGAIAFIRAVLVETEKYWCPIHHLAKSGFDQPAYHKTFAPDGDAAALQKIATSYPYQP